MRFVAWRKDNAINHLNRFHAIHTFGISFRLENERKLIW